MDPAPPLPLPPSFAVRLALALRRLLLRAADAVVPAQVGLFERAIGTGLTGLVGLAAHHRFADLLAEGALPAEELARRTGLSAEPTARALRALASNGLFLRDADGRYRNNRLSAGLRSDRRASMRDFCDYMASRSNLDAWTALREVVRTGHNGFEQVHGMSVWDWFERHPEEREVFAGAMVSLTEIDAPGIARAYPWREVRRVCDVGGGRGQLLAEILRANPHLGGMLVDGAGVLEGAQPFLAQQRLLERVELVPGSFFEGVPEGADLYLLKDILHDWDDARAGQILQRVRAAARPGARVLICEQLLEPGDTHGFAPLIDVQMMVVCCEGRQRSRAELRTLLERSGFAPGRIFQPATPAALVEGIAR